MDNMKLIELVREHAFLYDISDRWYCDNQKKDAVWKEISKKLKVQEKDCKKTWALLRDSFRRAIKKQREIKNGQANAIYKKWKYQDEMSFLIPFIKKRTTLYTSTPKDEDRVDYEVSLNSEGSIYSEDQPSDEVSPDNNSFGLATTTNVSPVIRSPNCNCQRWNSSVKKTSDEASSTALMKYILDSKKNTNDIEQFFASMATTVTSFPPQERAIAKAKVFELISKMEIEILSSSTTFSGKQSPLPF